MIMGKGGGGGCYKRGEASFTPTKRGMVNRL